MKRKWLKLYYGFFLLSGIVIRYKYILRQNKHQTHYDYSKLAKRMVVLLLFANQFNQC